MTRSPPTTTPSSAIHWGFWVAEGCLHHIECEGADQAKHVLTVARSVSAERLIGHLTPHKARLQRTNSLA